MPWTGGSGVSCLVWMLTEGLECPNLHLCVPVFANFRQPGGDCSSIGNERDAKDGFADVHPVTITVLSHRHLKLPLPIALLALLPESPAPVATFRTLRTEQANEGPGSPRGSAGKNKQTCTQVQ